jgi:hypothetical protein
MPLHLQSIKTGTVSDKIMDDIRFEVFTAVTVKYIVFRDIKPQFVLHRRHITSPLPSLAG